MHRRLFQRKGAHIQSAEEGGLQRVLAGRLGASSRRVSGSAAELAESSAHTGEAMNDIARATEEVAVGAEQQVRAMQETGRVAEAMSVVNSVFKASICCAKEASAVDRAVASCWIAALADAILQLASSSNMLAEFSQNSLVNAKKYQPEQILKVWIEKVLEG